MFIPMRSTAQKQEFIFFFRLGSSLRFGIFLLLFLLKYFRNIIFLILYGFIDRLIEQKKQQSPTSNIRYR